MPGPKQNNNQRFPDATRQPRHLDRLRKEGAKERQTAADKLTPEQKLERLDAKFGPGKGATKERLKLADKIAKRNSAPPPKQEVQSVLTTEGMEQVSVKKQKKYMKGAK